MVCRVGSEPWVSGVQAPTGMNVLENTDTCTSTVAPPEAGSVSPTRPDSAVFAAATRSACGSLTWRLPDSSTSSTTNNRPDVDTQCANWS